MKSFLESFKRRKIDEAFENPLPSWIKDSYRSDKFVIDEIVNALKKIYSDRGIKTGEKASWNRFADNGNTDWNKFKIDISKVKFIEEEIPDNKNAFNKMLKDPKRLNILLVELYYTSGKPITYYPFIFTAYEAFNDVYLADTDRASDTAAYRGTKWLKKYNDNSVASDSIEKYKYLSAIPIKDLYEMAVKYCYIDISDATAYLENNREKYVPSEEDNRHQYKQKMRLTWDGENNYNPEYKPSFTTITGNHRIPGRYSIITTDKSGYEVPNIQDRIAKAKSMGFNPSKLNATYNKLLKLQKDIQDFENKYSKLPSREFTKSMTADEVQDFINSANFSRRNNLENAQSYLESAVNYFKRVAENLQSFIEYDDPGHKARYITRIDDYLKDCERYIQYAYETLDITDD